jgi:hypothetical protein
VSLLQNIKLSEAEETEFNQRLSEWRENTKAEIKSELEKQFKDKGSRITEDGDLDLTEEESAILKAQLVEWKEKIKEETEESLGDKFYQAYKKGEDKLKKSYSEKFIKTLKEMYEEVEVSVREKLQESSEFKAFTAIKKSIAPFIIEGEYSDSVLEDTTKLKAIIKEQSQKLEDIKIKTKLDQLTEGMPADFKNDFIESLGAFSTEDELIEKFQKQINLVKNVKSTVISEMEDVQKISKVETVKEPEVKETPAPIKEEEVIAPKVVTPEAKPKTEAPKAPEKKVIVESAPIVEEDLEDKIDYDVLTEEFKRKEKKHDSLQRMRELAGLI